jgi:hypothetical protein
MMKTYAPNGIPQLFIPSTHTVIVLQFAIVVGTGVGYQVFKTGVTHGGGVGADSTQGS